MRAFTCGDDFHATVAQIAHSPDHAQLLRVRLNEPAKADTLDFAGDQEVNGFHRSHLIRRFVLIIVLVLVFFRFPLAVA